MTVLFTAATPLEWLDLPTVERILSVTRAEVLALVDSGKLRARSVNGQARIASSSLDRYCERRPLFGRPAPDTFIKVNGRVYREI